MLGTGCPNTKAYSWRRRGIFVGRIILPWSLHCRNNQITRDYLNSTGDGFIDSTEDRTQAKLLGHKEALLNPQWTTPYVFFTSQCMFSYWYILLQGNHFCTSQLSSLVIWYGIRIGVSNNIAPPNDKKDIEEESVLHPRSGLITQSHLFVFVCGFPGNWTWC